MDPYKILGVRPDANPEDIKKAFHKKAHLHHPDKGGDVRKFKEALEAYQTLSDRAKRAEYDAYRASFRKSENTDPPRTETKTEDSARHNHDRSAEVQKEQRPTKRRISIGGWIFIAIMLMGVWNEFASQSPQTSTNTSPSERRLTNTSLPGESKKQTLPPATAPVQNNEVCGTNELRSEVNGSCISRSRFCIEKYGANRIYNRSSNACDCDTGYVTSKAGLCITRSQACEESWPNTSWNGTFENGKYVCDCKDGYSWNANQTSCIKNCAANECRLAGKCVTRPENSHCVTGVNRFWECDSEYYELIDRCWSVYYLDSQCKATRGNGSYFNGKVSGNEFICDCAPGYHYNENEKCVSL